MEVEYTEETRYSVRSSEGALYVFVVVACSGESLWVLSISGDPFSGRGVVLGKHEREDAPNGGDEVEYTGGSPTKPPGVVFTRV